MQGSRCDATVKLYPSSDKVAGVDVTQSEEIDDRQRVKWVSEVGSYKGQTDLSLHSLRQRDHGVASVRLCGEIL